MHPPRPSGLQRAVQIGVSAGLVAALLWPVYAIVQEPARWPFMAALAIAAVCGLWIVGVTAIDLLTVHRARAVLPARMFDLALGLAMAVPSAAGLDGLLR